MTLATAYQPGMCLLALLVIQHNAGNIIALIRAKGGKKKVRVEIERLGEVVYNRCKKGHFQMEGGVNMTTRNVTAADFGSRYEAPGAELVRIACQFQSRILLKSGGDAGQRKRVLWE